MLEFEKLSDELVSNGIAALNEIKPGWLDSMPLNLRRLDAMDPQRCILKNAYGDFMVGVRAMVSQGYDICNYGFASPREWADLPMYKCEQAWDTLAQTWRRRVTELRGF